jgi:hypothetical protein
MHFKTDNPEIIHAALTGEINGIKVISINYFSLEIGKKIPSI